MGKNGPEGDRLADKQQWSDKKHISNDPLLCYQIG